MPDLQTLTKKPTETRTYAMNFAALLDAGDSLTTVVGSPTVTPADGTLTISSVTVASPLVSMRIAGGADNTDPKITIKVNTSLGSVLTGTGYLKLKEF